MSKFSDSAGHQIVPVVIVDASGAEMPVADQSKRFPSRLGLSKTIFVEQFRSPMMGMYHDGAAGSTSRDTEIMFNDMPSCRLDPQGTTTNLTDPQNSPITNGIVLKRRIVQVGPAASTGKFGWDGWLKWTSQNLTTNVFTTVSLYNRDGTNQNGFRVWLDTINAANQVLIKVYDQGSAGWVQVYAYNLAVAQHAYDPINAPAVPDTAGMWNYFRLVGDFGNGRYVSLQFNEIVIDVSPYTMISLASAGARALHFSVEFSQKTATRRFMNVANLRGTQEG